MRIVPGKRYTPEQLREYVDQATADQLQMQGYVLQLDVLSGTYAVVHWTNAASGAEFGELRKPRTGQGVFEPLDPIKKRTPAERVDSLMLKLLADCKTSGTVPGLTDARIKHITGEAFKAGRTEITGEVVRKVAADFLAKAEQKRKVDDFKKLADLNPST